MPGRGGMPSTFVIEQAGLYTPRAAVPFHVHDFALAIRLTLRSSTVSESQLQPVLCKDW